MNAMFKFTYGLFVLTAKEGNKDNGCIINTAIQVTSNPRQVSVCVNKADYTAEMIKRTGKFNLSFLNQDVKFDIFQRFGLQSGRNVDKFADYKNVERSENGLYYILTGTNAMISVTMNQCIDVGTHYIIVGDVTEEKVFNDVPSVSYQYYFDHIKPKPEQKKLPKKGFVCKICGYVYEGDVLPPDFICPVCKHGAEAFEPIV